jgi:iduronate 2-sulfatase
MCPAQSSTQNCTQRPGLHEPGSWTEPYFFCDQYTNDTVQSPAMQEWQCSLHGAGRESTYGNGHFSWPSCGGGCVQSTECIQCFTTCGTWGEKGSWDACDCPDSCYPEGVIAAQTIRVLGQQTETTPPFFHACGFKRPHLSYRAPQKYFDLYKLQDIPLPLHRYPSPSAPPISYSHSCVHDSHTSQKAAAYGVGSALFEYGDAAAQDCQTMVVNRTYGDKNLSTGALSRFSRVEVNTNDTSVREMRLAYYAVISFMDSQLGRVLDKLESSGLDKNTLVTFIGDHGYQNGEKGEWCKSNNFELATRIPMWVVVPPSLQGNWARGVVQPAIVESVDLYPTLADLVRRPLRPFWRPF